MKLRIQFGGVLIALAFSVGMTFPCAAQNRNANRPPQQKQAQRPAQRQERRQEAPRGQSGRPNPNAGRPGNNGAANRPGNNFPANRPNESAGPRNEGNRPSNLAGESGRQPNFNPNRPPNASNSQASTRRLQDLSPAERQKVLENNRRLQKLSPAEHQELHQREQVWGRLTSEQKGHIKNDILPKWQQMSPPQQRAIRQRLGVLQNMPESARNQHLNDPNFTRGMSEEDKAMLRDLSHMHVGVPDPPNE